MNMLCKFLRIQQKVSEKYRISKTSFCKEKKLIIKEKGKVWFKRNERRLFIGKLKLTY